MKLQVLSSSSKGNCYILQNDQEALIIEAGVPYLDIKRALNFNLNKVVGCIISHRHKDHSKSVKNLLNDGVKVYALEDVFAQRSVFSYKITPGQGFYIKGFRVYPFSVKHDVPCLGFVITHKETGNILFITDTININLSFSSLNHIMIEANYSEDNMHYTGQMQDRALLSHMDIATTKKIIAAQDISSLRNIILMHLSDSNSDEKQFVNEITSSFGVPTYIASKGLNIELTKEWL